MNLNCFGTSFEVFHSKVRIILSSTSFGDVSIKQCLKIFFFNLRVEACYISCEYNAYVCPVVLEMCKIFLVMQVHLMFLQNLLGLGPIQMRKTIEIQQKHWNSRQ